MLSRALRRGGAERDPLFSSVALLLPFDAGFNDASYNGFTASVTGSPSIQAAFITQFTGNCAVFGGSDYLTFSNNAALDLDTGDFTIEMWFTTSASSGVRSLISHGVGGANGYVVRVVSDGSIEFIYGASTTITTPSGVVDWHANSKYYFKIGRNAGVISRTYAVAPGDSFPAPDGWNTDQNTTLGAVGYDFTTTSPLYVGANRSAGQLHIGRIDELRITRGHWRGFGRPRVAHLQR